MVLVYGDRRSEVATGAALDAIRETLRAAGAASGWRRHDLLSRAFVDLAGLAQGLADAEFQAKGVDDLSEGQSAAVHALRAVAAALAASWDGREARVPDVSLGAAPPTVTVNAAEGHEHYAVYPEAYLAAARSVAWGSPPLVIGLRSIGLGLAAMVAEATYAAGMVSLRPTGPPFRRELRVSDRLRERLRGHAGPFAVVDEGPGLSGSSFGAVLDLLETLGVGRERIVVLPSHAGAPGPEAASEHRVRWTKLRRVPAAFDAQPLQRLFADLIGPAWSLEDLSGGAWRAGRPLPAFPQQERLKFRLRTGSGVWLAKFAGLGATGEAKFARAKALHAAGFTPEPKALRWGFLLSRWEDGVQGKPGLEHLARYLGFRARAFPASRAGAGLPELAEMARRNLALLGAGALAERLEAPGVETRPVHIDGRLHPWEWIATPDGRLLKTDAVDHSCAHDLVGCQDIAWDVAGAAVEFDLAEEDVDRLCTGLAAMHGRAVDRTLLAFLRICYAAFQAGLWSYAAQGGDPGAAARVQHYVRHASAGLGQPPASRAVLQP